MFAIVSANLLRSPGRTIATAMGIAVGVGMIVALLSFTQGLKETAAGFVHLGGSDLGLFQANVSDPTASLLPESMVERVAAHRAVSCGDTARPDSRRREGGPVGDRVRGEADRILLPRAGARLRAHTRTRARQQVLIGDRLAAQQHLGAGSAIVIGGHPYTVSGVYHSGILFEDSGAVLSLAQAQAVTGRPGEVTDIVVQLAPGTAAQSAVTQLQRDFPGTQAISDPQQALRAGANATLISKAILVIVVIALIVGAISVANTMAMSIMERQGEIGILATVGWSPVRVASLVLSEGVAVSVLGAAAGLLLGVIGGGLLVKALGVSTYVTPSVTAWGLGRALLVGVAIGVLGGIYPAWRVTRMQPLKALANT